MPQASRTLEDVFSLINADASIVGMVGTRIYPNVAPQNAALPFIVYELVGSTPNRFTESAATSGDFDTIQISCFCRTNAEAIQLADYVLLELDEQDDSQSQLITLVNDSSGGDVSDNNADDRVHWRHLTFEVITS